MTNAPHTHKSPQQDDQVANLSVLRLPRALGILALLSALLLAALLLSLAVGSLPIALTDLLPIITGQAEPGILHSIVLELRLPRALSAILVGAQLALAGCLMQVLLRNPLADPYVLGVSGGAAVGALLSMLAGLGSWAVSGSALIGALVNLIIVFGLAHGSGIWSPTRLLLTGVVCASGWGAAVSFILSVAADNELRGMLFWLMGDLSYASVPTWQWLILAVGVAISLALARPLNLMQHGEMQAKALGVPIFPIQIILYLLASVLTASAVTQAGSIGFLGLVVPHLLRLLIGSDHRLLLPAAALSGACLLLLADTAARTLWAPQQLPVGVITAMLGVPLFLYVLQRSNKGGRL